MLKRALFKGLIFYILFALLIPYMPPVWEHGGLYDLFIIPKRKRFPFTRPSSTDSYSVRIDSIPVLFNTHEISEKKKEDEFRIIVLGDSSVWGARLPASEIITEHLNRHHLSFCGKQAHFYNLGHPNPSLIKDLMILDYAMQYEPDYVIWFVTLEAFPLEKQVTKIPILVNNPERTRDLLQRYQISIQLDSSVLPPRSYWQKTLFGQRSMLKDILKIQLYGVLWAATGIDESLGPFDPFPTEFAEDDIKFQDTILPPLKHEDLTYNVLEMAMNRIRLPILLINEPMMHSPVSEIRYNLRYPRWAYDSWHTKMQELASQHAWNYLDLGDKISSPEFYTDSAFHLNPTGEALLASYLVPSIQVSCP